MLEQHPVPQNVTTFQFRLIGDMTLKQFAYLAGGAILAYISFHLPLPFFFTYPLTGIFALGGIGFAFVPIEERPMDVWVLSFIRSVYNPTQYIWQRELTPAYQPGTQTGTVNKVSYPGFNIISTLVDKILPMPKPKNSTQTLKPSLVADVHPPLQQAPTAPAPSATPPPTVQKVVQQTPPKSVVSVTKPVQQTVAHPPQPTQPTPAYAPAVYPSILTNSPLPRVDGVHLDTTPKQNTQPQQQTVIEKKQDVPDHKMEELEKRLVELEQQLEKEREEKKKFVDIQQQLVTALQDKQQIEQQLQQTQQQMSSNQKLPETQPIHVAVPTPSPSSTVKIISPQAAKTAGMPSISSFPNVISGIVREKGGNLLVGILVTVKDKEDVPVRALKTNKLGQFAASTPLSNGDYILEVEDPKNQFSFDLAKVTLNGGVVPPVELIAKTKQDLDRQKLENALFGNQPQQ